MKKKFISACLVALSCVTSISAIAHEEKPLDAFIRHVKETHSFETVNNLWQPDASFDNRELLKNVEKAQPLTIDYTKVADFIQKKLTAIELVIPGPDGTSYTIELARYDFTTNDFEVHGVGENNTDKLLDYTPGLHYSGIVKGIPGSLASFSFFKNEVYGMFSTSEGNFVVVPNTMVGESYNYNQNYIVYNDQDILFKDKAPKCGTDLLQDVRPAQKTTTTANNNVYNNCTEVRCFEVVDYTMYTKKGSNATNVTNFVTSLFNAKNTIYRNEGIPIVLKYLQINTTTDRFAPLPTTSSSIWLDTFGKITQNTMHGCDQATLFTTKGGSMGGVAWLGTMCMAYQASSFAGPYAFCNLDNNSSLTVSAFPTFSWNVEVSAHEMGHNLGSPHTHRCCWGPTRTTAIDGCYTIEGTCANPGNPTTAVGGTIMSYCHLTSSGIKFVNGFGTQPGDTVRYEIANTFSSSCGAAYHPSYALNTSGRTLVANRECTDLSTGYTYYWKDNLTASHADDTLVLMIKKNANTIGNLNTTGFAVKQTTLATFGTGAGTATTFPAGTLGVGATNVSMDRYWSIAGATAPITAVEVVFPFVIKDSADVDGSVTGAPLALTNFRMYKVNSSTVSPDPSAAFTGGTASNFSIYKYGATASTTNWSLTRSGDTCFAHILTTNLTGGGSGFYPSGAITGVENVTTGSANVFVYPNPTDNNWFVSITGSTSNEMTMQIYSADGKLVHVQSLLTSSTNTVNAEHLPVGMYYYRVVGNESTYTGSLMKK